MNGLLPDENDKIRIAETYTEEKAHGLALKILKQDTDLVIRSSEKFTKQQEINEQLNNELVFLNRTMDKLKLLPPTKKRSEERRVGKEC